MSVGVSLASYISADFVGLFEFYSATFELPEVEELHSDIFRGADASGVTIGFSAPVVYEMLNIQEWAEPKGTTQYLTFECENCDAVVWRAWWVQLRPGRSVPRSGQYLTHMPAVCLRP